VWWMRRGEETRAARQLACMDAYLIGAEEWHDARSGLSKPGVAAMTAFKERYGEMKYNLANRAIAGDFIRGWLQKEYPDMRAVDRIRHCELAIEMALTPSQAALEAAEFARDSAVRARRAAYTAPR
jgi:hypothetical protein